MTSQLKKQPGVAYFNHFPKNFLVPYGRQKPLPPAEKLFDRLEPEGCEWLRRPHIAISELGSTLHENLSLLQNDSNFLDASKISVFIEKLKPLNTILEKFSKDYEGRVTEEQHRHAALSIIAPPSELIDSMKEAVEVGRA